MQDATQASRCLAMIEKMTGWELLSSLLPVVLRLARLVRCFRRGDVTPEAMFEFETALEAHLREIGRFIVQWTINRLEPDDRAAMPQHLLWDGEYFRRRSRSPLRSLHCVFGPVSLRRFCYQPLETCGRCLFPLELQLGIVAGVATPALANAVARASADLTQGQLLEQLRQQNIHWGVRTLRKLTRAMAKTLSPHLQQAQVQQVLGWLQEASQKPGPRRIALSVGRDGIMVPVVKSKKYKEAAAATLSVMNRYGRRVGTVYLGQMPEAHQRTLSDELTSLLREVLGRWEGAMPRLIYVTDCGHHPTEYYEAMLCKMTNPRRPAELLQWEWIVDYYHACEYITKLAEAIFGPGRKAFAWAAKQRRILKEKPSGCFRVLRSAGALLATRGLVGSEEQYCTAYQYLRTRAKKMDYATYRRLRLPIGSGITEAACKVVFTQRFKQSGMKWTIEGGSVILKLRLIALSGVWTTVRHAALRSYKLPEAVTPRRFDDSPPQNQRKTAA